MNASYRTHTDHLILSLCLMCYMHISTAAAILYGFTGPDLSTGSRAFTPLVTPDYPTVVGVGTHALFAFTTGDREIDSRDRDAQSTDVHKNHTLISLG
jgi:hypothetical protein